jgi:phosphoribosylanthranilate isomerase
MYLRVKICGVTQVADAVAAAEAGADALGLNFYPSSPRFIDSSKAAAILQALPPFVEPVGVFVSPAVDTIVHTLERLCDMRMVQCHGTLPELAATPSIRLIPAFSVRDKASLEDVSRYIAEGQAMNRLPPAVLLDAHVPGQYGGTGHTAPWKLLADFCPGVPILLAGGLTPQNVAEAVRIVRPYGVDVASGVEGSPGQKDPDKVRRFIENARAAAQKLT